MNNVNYTSVAYYVDFRRLSEDKREEKINTIFKEMSSGIFFDAEEIHNAKIIMIFKVNGNPTRLLGFTDDKSLDFIKYKMQAQKFGRVRFNTTFIEHLKQPYKIYLN